MPKLKDREVSAHLEAEERGDDHDHGHGVRWALVKELRQEIADGTLDDDGLKMEHAIEGSLSSIAEDLDLAEELY